MTRSLILIGAGSCLGGISRYLTPQFVQTHYPSSLPTGTLSVHMIVCFISGLIYALAEGCNILSPVIGWPFATGFCGEYTSCSCFAYEHISLMQGGGFFYGGLCVLFSVVIAFTVVYFGILFIKLIS